MKTVKFSDVEEGMSCVYVINDKRLSGVKKVTDRSNNRYAFLEKETNDFWFLSDDLLVEVTNLDAIRINTNNGINFATDHDYDSNKIKYCDFEKNDLILKTSLDKKYDGKSDVVEHPKHYNSHPSGVECIEITRHMSFNLGNVIKYLWRTEHKNGLEDLKKARWYLNDEIGRLGGDNQNVSAKNKGDDKQ